MENKIPVILITGYLGAGKTTLLNELLQQEERKVALIVNDIGSVNIDAKLLKQGNIAGMDTNVVELSNGCICCTLREEFMEQIDEISKCSNAEIIFVEASGVSDPSSIAEAFLVYEQTHEDLLFFLDTVITVVDADRVHSEFLYELEGKTKDDEEKISANEDVDIINLVMDQIEFCNVIGLNKCDLLGEEELTKIEKVLKRLQSSANIIRSIHGKVKIEDLLNDEPFDFEEVLGGSAIQRALAHAEIEDEDEEEYGITSFVFEARNPLIREKFMDFINNDYPMNIIRAKGYIWFSDDDVHVQLFEQAGRNAVVSKMSNWVASLSAEEQKNVFEEYPEVRDDWDEVYGDRMIQIVFIGKNIDKEHISAKISECIHGEEQWKDL